MPIFSLVLLFGVLINFETSKATTGVDVSQSVSQVNFFKNFSTDKITIKFFFNFQSTWTCLKNNGVKFGIVRIYQSTGRPDPNAVKTIKNARNAGISYVDGYIFPCKRCGNPKSQVQRAVQNLKNNGARIGQVT